jgi:hypothetical protein
MTRNFLAFQSLGHVSPRQKPLWPFVVFNRQTGLG